MVSYHVALAQILFDQSILEGHDWSFKIEILRSIHLYVIQFIIVKKKKNLIGTITLRFGRGFRKKRLAYNLIQWSQQLEIYISKLCFINARYRHLYPFDIFSILRNIYIKIVRYAYVEINCNLYLMQN